MRRPLLLLTFLLVLAPLAACRREPPAPPRLSATAALSGATRDPQARAGYAKAIAPRPFDFPADHGSHPDFETEWWYFTGHLATAEGDGRRFGFQLTFFRRALAAEDTARESAWATRQLYFAHFTLTDVQGGRFHSFERFARGALGLAEAEAEPFRVAVEDWRVAATGPGLFPLALRARDGEVTLELELNDRQGWVAQGDQGLSRKSAGEGNASYYYSFPRLSARGKVELGGKSFAVAGEAWLDREWSTSALGPGQAGWDWFSLQLADGRNLMLYRLRQQDGSRDPFSAGALIESDGGKTALGAGDFTLEAGATWRSPRSGAVYPVEWRVALPGLGMDCATRALLPDQELDVSFRYWEGAVDADCRQNGRRTRGRGYVEMVGYAEGEEGG